MFLEVVTRTFGQRPTMLARCRASLETLTDPDWKQRIVMDKQGRGVAWANRNLSTITAHGEWIWLLDDDDLCAYADLIVDLKELVASKQPDLIIARVWHDKYGLLPPYEDWGKRPIMGRYGGECAFYRREIWNKYRHGWTQTYAGDFWFINDLWDAGLKIAWLPVIVARQPQESNGAGEPDAR